MRESTGRWIAAIRSEAGRFVPSNPSVRFAAARLRALFEQVPTACLPGVDVALRPPAWSAHALTRLDPEGFAALRAAAQDDFTVAAFASTARDGHVREAAVVVLGDLIRGGDGRAVRWLVLRAADPVDAVAEQAVVELDRCAAVCGSPAWRQGIVDCLTMPASDRFAVRPMARYASRRVRGLLASPALRDEVHAATRATEPRLRRAAVALIAEAGDGTNVLPVLLEQLDDGDVVSIGIVAAAALADPTTSLVAARELFDRGPPRERAAAWVVLLHAGAVDDRLLDRGLADRSALVRDNARREAAARGVDVRLWYRDRLDTEVRTALRGLAEVGTADDVNDVLVLLDDPRPGVALAALQVVARRGVHAHADVLAERFTSGVGARVAAAGLRRLDLGVARLDAIWADSTTDPEALRRFLRMLVPHASRWAELRFGLLALATVDDAAQLAALASLRRTLAAWNRSATNAPREIDAARSAFAVVASRLAVLDPALRREVELLLRLS